MTNSSTRATEATARLPARTHAAASPSPPKNPTAAPATFSPRRPAQTRSVGGATAVESVDVARDTMHTPPNVASATRDTLVSATTASGSRGGNPHVRAIQSRVAEVMRRYDESMANDRASLDDDDDDARVDVPRRWKVGDVLLATHSALSKTSTSTERTMIADFTDDTDVEQVIGEGEANFSRVIEAASEKAAQMKTVMTKSLHMVKQLQQSDELMRLDENKTAGASATQLRDMKITIEALHKEKAMVLGQLHEHAKSHKEMMNLMEEQNQELKRAQIALGMRNDEIKAVRDDYAARLADLQKMFETSQQNLTMWRDKYQNGLKSLGEAEQKMVELEKKVHAQAEEIIKHEVVLRAKNQEVEKHRDRLKESEAQRIKAESAQRDATAAAAAATASATAAAAAAAANRAAEADARSKKADGGNTLKLSNQERQELEAKIRHQDVTIRELQQKLRDINDTRGKFEEDNNELARIVRELQSRAQFVMNSNPSTSTIGGTTTSHLPHKLSVARRSTSFSLASLRREPTQKRTRSRGSLGSAPSKRKDPDDDLSTSSDEEEAAEADRDVRELTETVQQVVTAVFPLRMSPISDSDEKLIDSIAQYEDPVNSLMVTTTAIASGDETPSNAANVTPMTREDSALQQQRQQPQAASIPVSSASTFEALRAEHEDVLARLKKQYVTGLLEYKKLVIEQYERRQSEIQQHHRIEIENLIMLVQQKFKEELDRRGEKMLQAKESLKLLYRAMKMDTCFLPAGFNEEEADATLSTKMGSAGDDDLDRLEEPVPLKSLLRAAVFAMSSSKRRNEEATMQITNIYENVRHKKTSRGGARAPVVKVTAKDNSTRVAQPVPPNADDNKEDGEVDWSAFLRSMRPTKDGVGRYDAAKAVVAHVASQVDPHDFVIYELKGLRGNHIAPEDLDGYVLSTSPLLGDSRHAVAVEDTLTLAQPHRRSVARGVLSLAEGSLFSDDIVHELRSLLPFLPPGSYFLSGTLRHQLLLQMLRFYSDLRARQTASEGSAERPHLRGDGDKDDDVCTIVLGSPRETPFMRRKATESLDRKRIQRRRDLLSNGGAAMLQQLSSPHASSRSQYANPHPILQHPASSFPMSHVGHGRSGLVSSPR